MEYRNKLILAPMVRVVRTNPILSLISFFKISYFLNWSFKRLDMPHPKIAIFMNCSNIWALGKSNWGGFPIVFFFLIKGEVDAVDLIITYTFDWSWSSSSAWNGIFPLSQFLPFYVCSLNLIFGSMFFFFLLFLLKRGHYRLGYWLLSMVQISPMERRS